MLPLVAIAGRPNVGKSTLFNRLTGTPHALVDDTPGVTRDVREGVGRIAGLSFRLMDTAGLEEADDESLASRMTDGALKAASQADVILLIIDTRAGITPTDRHFASLLRKTGRPLVLVANKAEAASLATLAEAYSLGLGEPVAVSAAHGEGMGELYRALAAHIPEAELPEDSEQGPLQIAIVGRPNAGKSTLVNRLLGEDRQLTGPEAGITRDAIAIPFEWQGRAIKLVDTAGLRRKANIQEKLEKMSAGDSLRAVRYAEVVVLVLDAVGALEKQDNTLAALVEREGRAAIIALNKWDLVENKSVYMKEFEKRLAEVMPQFKGISVVPISAERGTGLDRLMQQVFEVHDLWNRRIPTGELNRFLEAALATHAPPLIDGRRLKIRYMTQVKTRPPTFTLFSNLSDVPDHYTRYLSNSMREAFGLRAVPIRLRYKKNKNPYEGEGA